MKLFVKFVGYKDWNFVVTNKVQDEQAVAILRKHK